MAAVASVALPPPNGPTQGVNSGSDNEADECWICLSSAGPLSRPCDCPRFCHRECIATWQLTNYGRREENFCRFCNKRLPALWKPDPANEAEKEELRIAPVMAVRYNGPEGTREFKLRVRPGPEGLATFKAHLKEVLGFDVGPEFDVTFECQMPSTGSMLTLSGLNAYAAATHCAALLAATKSGAQSASSPAAPAQPPAAASAQDMAAPSGSSPTAMTFPLQPQECAAQSSRTLHQRTARSVVPALLLPSEVPPVAAGAAAVAVELPSSAAAALRARPSGCGRRVCQTGYMPHGSIPVRQQPSGGASSSITGTSYMSGISGGRQPALVTSRSVGGGWLRRSLLALSDRIVDDDENMVMYDDPSDDLLPHGSKREMPAVGWMRETATGYEGHPAAVRHSSRSSAPVTRVAAAVMRPLQDAASSASPGEDATTLVTRDSASANGDGRPSTSPALNWTASAVRFGGLRVQPTSASGSGSPAAAVLATPADSGQFSPTFFSGSASAPVEREVHRLSPDGQTPTVAELAAPLSDTRGCVGVANGLGTPDIKDLAVPSLRLAAAGVSQSGPAAAGCSATRTGRVAETSSAQQLQTAQGAGDARAVAASGPAREKLTAAIQRAARRTAEAIARAVTFRPRRSK